MIPKSTLVAYGLPALPLAALTLPLYIVVPTFYAEALGLPLATIGAVLLAIRVFDALNDPVIGWLADRYPQRGRRKVWLGMAVVPGTAAAFALFWPPTDATYLWLGASAAALSIGFAFPVLEAAGFDPVAATSAAADFVAEGTAMLSVLYALVLVGLKIIAIAMMWSFPLDEARLHSLRMEK